MEFFGIHITYKKLNTYLLVAIVPLAFIVYQLGIARSLELAKDNSRLESNLNAEIESPDRIQKLQKKALQIDALFKNYVANEVRDREVVLSLIGDFCFKNRLLVYKVPEVTTHEADGYTIETFEFAVQGGYLNMVRLVDYLEQQEQIGKIASVKFELIKDMATKTNLLIGKIFLQRIIVDEKKLR